MTTTVKANSTITLPPAIRKRARIAPGDEVDIRAIGGVITITSKMPPSDEYTPANGARSTHNWHKPKRGLSTGRSRARPNCERI